MKLLRSVLLIGILLTGCREVPMLPSITPYRIDVQQGNVVTQEMVDKLKPGMTQSQVRFILGTPLVVDTFHKDRWDYVYRYEKAGRLQENRRIVVVFQDEKLVRIEGDVVAAKAGGATESGVKVDPQAQPGNAAKAKEEKPKEDKPKEERGFFGRMLEKLGF